MNQFMSKLEEKLTSFGAKLQKIVFLQAVSESLQATLPILIVGSFATLITSLDVGPWQTIVKGIPGLVQVCSKITSFTSGGYTLLMLVALAIQYCKKIEIKESVSITALTVAVFLILSEVTDGNIASSALGMRGMILALAVGVLVPKCAKFLLDKDLKVHMPDSVPKFVEEGFAVLIPAAIICVCASLLNYCFTLLGYTSFQTFFYSMIQLPVQNIGLSFGGFIFIMCLVAMIMWPGLHASTVSAFIQPLAIAASAANLEAWNAGQTLPNVIEYQFMQNGKFGGGANLLLPCLVALFFCKSKQLKSVAKLGIIPACFCIGEPILFGFPMMLNPLMIFPMVLSTITTYVIFYIGVASGLVGRFTGIVLPWTTPPVLNMALSSSTPVPAIIMQIIAIAVGMLVYYPFIKAYDRRLVEQENAAEKK
ncbi:MAG: PTS sugar transporter subunit IIC [Erysipelotrichaceae bacterium]|nr:PTS sugar transporter subunit IIC [Erysipelotrichaceae bacterium]MBQ6126348.1 PTS sugar transporter subunit IIC [Erysipelotrichaceae bacterium]